MKLQTDGSIKWGSYAIELDTVDDDGLKKTGALHLETDAGVSGNLVLHEGTEPTVSATGAGHRFWVDASHNLWWQDEVGGNILLGYLDADAIAAIEGEATLEFQQQTVISTKAGAGAITLQSVGNVVKLEAGTQIRLVSDTLIFDNKKFILGTTEDYWFEYSSSGSRLLLTSRDIDGAVTEGVIARVLDGTQTMQFLGAIQSDIIDEFTADAGVTVEGVVLKDNQVGIGIVPTNDLHIEKNVAGVVNSKLYNQDSVDGIAHYLAGASGGGHVNLVANASSSAYLGIPAGMAGLAINYVPAIVFAVSGGATPVEKMRLTPTDLEVAVTVDGRDIATDGTKLDGIEDDAEVTTKEFFMSAGESILSSNASYDTPNNTYAVSLADAVTFARCFFTMHLPGDFTSMLTGYPKVVFIQGTGGTGNYRVAFDARAGGVGEQLGANIDNIAEYTMAAPGDITLWEEDVSAAFDGLSLGAGDSVGLQIQRDSDDSLDTFSGDLDVIGVVVKYA